MIGELLRRIHSARDTASLFTALGYTRDVQPLGEGSWLVARWKGFQVVASEGGDAPNAARTAAGRMAAGSRRALCVVVGRDQLAFAAPRLGTGGSTQVQRVSLTAPTPAAIRFLETLRPSGPNALAHALRLAELLSTEDVSDRFFVAFRQVLDRMVATMDRLGTDDERRTAALLPLTRILFLYFVQAKGWLDGRPDYLRRLLDSALAHRKNFHRDALNPLFFGVLNRPVRDRSKAAQVGSIPYLNGGLFEPHPVEGRIGPVIFPNELWRDAFDLLFEKFRFCVREADETDAIAPDMLGKVFERVMGAAQRHETGTFYTPQAVVRQIVEVALEAALRPSLGPDADALLENSGKRVRDVARAEAALRNLRVLDPAVGSGAFLLGGLERLTEIRLALKPEMIHRRSEIRRIILADNLFGVDLSPIAVRLAELRLWLAVIADDPTTDIAKVAPLPNLDGVIRQGDSLLDPIAAARACFSAPGSTSVELGRAVADARQALFRASGITVTRTMTSLRQRELALAELLVRGAEKSVVHRLRELAAQARSPDLFGHASGLSRAQRRMLRELLRHRSTLRRTSTALSNGQVPFFAFEVHAPDVMAGGGFNVVIGNPPWVRCERIPRELRETLARRFRWWRGSANRGYSHLPDLSVAFLERGLELTAPGGVLAMLLPAKLASAGYGEAARRHLVAETRIEYLHRVSSPEASAFRASIYPLALVLRKEPPSPRGRVHLGFHTPDALTQSRLDTSGPWLLIPDRERDAIEQLLLAGRPLGDIARPSLGVKTGADEFFVGSLVDRGGAFAWLRLPGGEIEIESELLRPAIRGRDVHPFHVRSQRMLIWAHQENGVPLPLLPPLASRYFEKLKHRLRVRADYRDGPAWTLFRIPREGDSRVVWRDIARRPAAAILDGSVRGPIPLNTCYVVSTPSKETAYSIAAVFNSTWCAVLARVIGDEAQAGYRRINARVASAFPIPQPGSSTDRLISLSRQAHDHPYVASGDLDDAVADALDLPSPVRRSLRSLAEGFRPGPSRRPRATSLVPAPG